MSATEATLVLFVAHLAENNITQATIKVYLAAVRQLHVSTGLHAWFNLSNLKGNQEASSSTSTHKSQATDYHTHHAKDQAYLAKGTYNNTMLWAACCMTFFGFMRVRKFTIPTKDGYDKGSHLS